MSVKQDKEPHAPAYLKTQKEREKSSYNLKVHLFKKIGKKDESFHQNQNTPPPKSSIISPATKTEATGFSFN